MVDVPFFRDLAPKRKFVELGLEAMLPAGAPDPARAGQSFRLSRGEPFARAVNRATSPGKARVDIVAEALIDVSNFLPSIFLDVGAARARAVAKITVQFGVDYLGQPGGPWYGTGFLVGPGLLLTNHHVLNSVDVAREAVAEFGFRTGANNVQQTPVSFRLLPLELFLTSRLSDGLDYTFVAIEPAAATQFGFVKLDRRVMAAALGSPANIVQHPGGRPQEVVLQQNEIEADDGVTLHYVSDTEGGSSGAGVFDNNWDLIALHHAAKKLPKRNRGAIEGIVNEGIKISAIAADLERLANGGDEAAKKILTHISNIDSGLGFFGALGRKDTGEKLGPERVVALYRGIEHDLDIGFWNIEWFSNRYETKVKDVAAAIADFAVDIWGLSESSPAAIEALIAELASGYGLEYAAAHSEPDAGTGKQSTSVIWNTKVVRGERIEWPSSVAPWFKIKSQDFDSLGLEAVHGKVFDRYPGLFRFEAIDHRLTSPFLLVPLHLKAMAEGSLRRSQATRILAAAIKRMGEESGETLPWILGGDFNAEIASGDFAALAQAGMRALTAGDESDGAFTYVESPYRSLIDHIYVTGDFLPRLDPDQVFIVAADKNIPDYVKRLSDHRPVVTRLVAADKAEGADEDMQDATHDLESALRELFPAGAAKPARPAAGARAEARWRVEAGGGPADGRITLDEFRDILVDPKTTEDDLRPFVRLDKARSTAFHPVITIDPNKVIAPPRPELEPESAQLLEFLNAWCRARRKLKYRERIKGGYTGPRFVSEGDSWFQYPILLDDVVDNLMSPYAIFSLDAGGDTLENMAASQEYLRAINEERPDALLLSGGGNDLLGEVDGVRRLKMLLTPFAAGKPAEDYLNPTFQALLKKAMGEYADIFKKTRVVSPKLPIFVHCYDYASPGAGGPWLKKPMEELGIRDPALQNAIIHVLIDKFAQALETLAKSVTDVVFVDTRIAVGGAAQWHDELHPKEPGFKRVAARFEAAIKGKLK